MTKNLTFYLILIVLSITTINAQSEITTKLRPWTDQLRKQTSPWAKGTEDAKTNICRITIAWTKDWWMKLGRLYGIGDYASDLDKSHDFQVKECVNNILYQFFKLDQNKFIVLYFYR